MNHQQEAEQFISSPIGKDSSYVDRRIAIAQVHATLALAEQQRIANLIALYAADNREGRDALMYDTHEGKSSFGASYVIRPEIASALGIGD